MMGTREMNFFYRFLAENAGWAEIQAGMRIKFFTRSVILSSAHR